MTTALRGRQMALPVWIGACSCLSFGHSAFHSLVVACMETLVPATRIGVLRLSSELTQFLSQRPDLANLLSQPPTSCDRLGGVAAMPHVKVLFILTHYTKRADLWILTQPWQLFEPHQDV